MNEQEYKAFIKRKLKKLGHKQLKLIYYIILRLENDETGTGEVAL